MGKMTHVFLACKAALASRWPTISSDTGSHPHFVRRNGRLNSRTLTLAVGLLIFSQRKEYPCPNCTRNQPEKR